MVFNSRYHIVTPCRQHNASPSSCNKNAIKMTHFHKYTGMWEFPTVQTTLEHAASYIMLNCRKLTHTVNKKVDEVYS